MTNEEIREDISKAISPGSMTKDNIVSELSDEYPSRNIKTELVDMILEDEIEEHPEIEGVYRTIE